MWVARSAIWRSSPKKPADSRPFSGSASPARNLRSSTGSSRNSHGRPPTIWGTSGMVAEVTNSGTEIPEDIVAQIFEPFFSTKPGGSGLGLAICRNIADSHRATIRVRNNARPKGVTFTVEFPASDLFASESPNGSARSTALQQPREIDYRSGPSLTGS